MLTRGSRVLVIDNSGAREAQIFGTYGGTKSISCGDIVKVAIKRVISNNENVKKGDVSKALVVRTRYAINNGGIYEYYGENAIILLNNAGELSLTTKIKGKISSICFQKQPALKGSLLRAIKES